MIDTRQIEIIEVSNINTLILMQEELEDTKAEGNTNNNPEANVESNVEPTYTDDSETPKGSMKAENVNNSVELTQEVEEQGVAVVEQEDLDVHKTAEFQLSHNATPVLPASGSYKQVIEAANALVYIEQLALAIKKSKLSPLKTVEDITLAIITGQQYGFHFMTSVACIFPINGKPTMSIHLHRALILSKGIHIEKNYDYEPIYSWGKVSEDGQWVLIDRKQADNTVKKVPSIAGYGTLDNPPESTTKIAKLNEVDRITQYTFTRLQKQLNGEYKELKVVSKFTMSQAAKAGLLDGKDNWAKYPHSMLDARAFGIGSKEIAADVLYGIYSISELADANNIPYTITDSLEERVSITQ